LIDDDRTHAVAFPCCGGHYRPAGVGRDFAAVPFSLAVAFDDPEQS